MERDHDAGGITQFQGIPLTSFRYPEPKFQVTTRTNLQVHYISVELTFFKVGLVLPRLDASCPLRQIRREVVPLVPRPSDQGFQSFAHCGSFSISVCSGTSICWIG